MMTKQEVYDKVKAHLLKQGKRCIIGLGIVGLGSLTEACVYGDPTTGMQCAVGCLIPFDIACKLPITGVHREDRAGRQVIAALEAAGVPTDDLALLRDLQGVHDQDEPKDWPAALEVVARQHGLVP